MISAESKSHNFANELVCCPNCRGDLISLAAEYKCDKCKKTYPIVGGIPRFVSSDNYASNFGFQWNLYSKTQVDRFNGTSISHDRFFISSGWKPGEMRDKRVLECGSGAGRFSQVISDTGAQLFTIDYSNAVEANAQNNADKKNIYFAQASLYELPFRENAFDYLVCLGVLQHTPKVEDSIGAMLRHLKPGGSFCFDAYAAPMSYLHPRHLLRPFTSRMPKEKLHSLVVKWVPRLLPLSTALHKVPVVGEYLARLVPIANWRKNIKLPNEEMYLHWALLDTFDWLSPTYEKPQSKSALMKALKSLPVRDVEIFRIRGVYVIRGKKA